MKIEINSIIKAMKDVVVDLYSSSYPKIKDVAEEYFADAKERLTKLTESLINNEIDSDFFKARIEDEKEIFKEQLISFEVMGEVIADQAITIAMTVFMQVIENAILNL